MLQQIKKKELLYFIMAGSSAVLTDYISYCCFLSRGMDTSLAKLAAFITGSIVGFVINKIWTFNTKGLLKAEIMRYTILYFITAYLNIFTNNLMLYLVKVNWFAFLCATGTSTIVNFLGMKFFVFRK